MSVTLYINGLCRCCFFDAPCRSDGIDSYSALLRETFNITIRPMLGPDNASKYTICDDCTSRLQDAAKFRKQVMECEKKFAEYVENYLQGDEEIEYEYSIIVKEEVETDDAMTHNATLLWPKAEISETLRQNEKSEPDTRLKLPCGVKRRNISSLELAEEQIHSGINTEPPPKRAYEPPPGKPLNVNAEKPHENTKEVEPPHHSPPVESEHQSEPTLRTTPAMRTPSSSETVQEPSSGGPKPISIERPPPAVVMEESYVNAKEAGPPHHSLAVESEHQSEPTLRTTPPMRTPSSSETVQEPSSGGPKPISIERPPPAVVMEESYVSTIQDLTQLLQSTQEGRLLLKQRSEPLTTSLRKTLVKEIAGEILKHDPKAPVTNDIYLHWIQQIEQVFPAENRSIYYKKNSEQGRAYGRLYDAVTNLKAKFRRSKVYQPRARRSVPDKTLSLDAENKGRPNESALVSLSQDDCAPTSAGDSVEIEACLEWLRSADSNNLAVCTEKWCKTRKQRMQRVLTEYTRTYLLEFPCLKRSWGHSLLTADFDQWYPGNENSFENKFPLLKKKLVSLFENISNKTSLVQELRNLVNSSESETSNTAALLTIPHHVGPVQTGKKKCSIAEVRQSFIARVENLTSINEECRKRHETRTLCSPIQPFVIVVGALEKITGRYVVVDDLIYELPDICSAVDTCFKIKWALNLKYTDECLPVWQFLQRAVYDIPKATDLKEKLPASVYALLNDCDIKS